MERTAAGFQPKAKVAVAAPAAAQTHESLEQLQAILSAKEAELARIQQKTVEFQARMDRLGKVLIKPDEPANKQ